MLADRLAALCDLAAAHAMTVELEFMPFRALATLGQAIDAVARAARPNARVVIDTGLHAKRWSRRKATDYMVEKTGFVRITSIAVTIAGRDT